MAESPGRRAAPGGQPSGSTPARRAHTAPVHAPAKRASGAPTPPKQPSSGTRSTKPKTASRKKKPGDKRWRQLTGGQKAGRIGLWAAIVITGALVVGLIGGLLYYKSVRLPNPNADFTTATTTLYYRDGYTEMGKLAVQNRTPLTFDEMPATIKDAVVAAEDRTFWTNPGISLPGMVRAAWNILRGGSVQSGSTLTQQYIKTLYLTSAQTPARKIKEVVLALKMTNTMPKEQILAGYLNTVYFGHGAYGIQAAAKAYFDVEASQLTVPQAAVLACQLRGPSLYDPSDPNDATRLMDRYNYVLDGMVEMEWINQTQADSYKNHLPDFPDIPTSDTYGGPTGFLMKMAESELESKGFTSDQIAGGGLQIITTFDARLQAAAVSSAQKFTQQAADKAKKKPDPTQLHAAIASVSVGTGEVLALYGGPDYVANSRNWATTPRMAGSTFKPFAFIAGERGGLSLKTTLTGNPIKINGQTINNDRKESFGPVSLLTATEKSINTAYVDLVQKIDNGPQQVIQAATDAGATPNDSWQPVPVIPLGTAEVSPLDMAGAYSTFANAGVHVPTHVVMQVKDSTGSIIYNASAIPQQAIDPGIASDLTFALQSVVDAGTGVVVKGLDYPAAGKTGTAGQTYDAPGTKTGTVDGVAAAWFVGYTAQVSTAVMYVANSDGVGNLNDYAPPGNTTFYGNTYPAQTWLDFMKQAMDGMPKVKFGPPAKVNQSNTPTPTTTTEPPGDQAPPPPVPTTSEPEPTTVAPPPPTSTTTSQPAPTHTTAPPTSATPSPTAPPPSTPPTTEPTDTTATT